MYKRAKSVIRHERTTDEILDFIGCSYSRSLNVMYKRVSRKEAWDLYQNCGSEIIFADSANLDESRFIESMTKKTLHRQLQFDVTFTFNKLFSMMADELHQCLGPGVQMFTFVAIH